MFRVCRKYSHPENWQFGNQPPIIQGGKGVRVSRANLAAAVANEGCVGVIAGAGIGKIENSPKSDFSKVNAEALRYEI